MSEIVNLRQARKARERDARRAAATENAARHGRSKAERARTGADLVRAAAHLDGHRRERPAGDEHL